MNLVKTGCAFAGWNTTSAGTGTTYAPGATFAVGNANVTLYAVWRSEFLYVADSTNATLAEGSYHGKLTFDTSGKFCLSDKDQGAYGLDVFSQDPPTGVLTHIGTEPGEAGLSIAGDILPLFLP